MTRIRLVGVGPDGRPAAGIEGCVAAVAAERFFPLVPPGVEPLAITPLDAALARVGERLERGDVAVLAGGDPLFFGIGRRLILTFGDRVEVFPAVSSMQALAARARVPWDDAGFESLHGRDASAAATTLLMGGKRKKFVLTDGKNSPASLARAMLARLSACGCPEEAENFRITVGGNLGLPDERVFRGTAAAAAETAFAALNLMLVEDTGPAVRQTFPGEDDIVHSRGLITKDEVRGFCVSAIAPPESGVMWDVGAGSGAVGLACGLIRPRLTVFAVERREEELANIRANIKRFRAFNLEPVAGEAPEVLEGLPAPQRVFIGGSGGRLAEIISVCHSRLAPGGRMVVNAVLEKSADTAFDLLAALGARPRATRIAAARGFGADRVEMNPITVITGVKQ